LKGEDVEHANIRCKPRFEDYGSWFPLVKTVVIGAINWDLNLFIDRFPRKGEEVVVRRIISVPGGKAGNAAVAAARLLGPNQVAIMGGLGNDVVASDQVRIFKDEGVDVSGLKFFNDADSGQAYIIIDAKGENIVHTHFGANAKISPDHLDEPIRRELITKSSVITIMDPPFETALKLAREARKLDKIIVWDTGIKSRSGLKDSEEILQMVDYVLANESEMAFLTGTKNLGAAARKMMRANRELRVVAKLGARGSIMYSKKEEIVSRALDLKSLGMKAMNTVGCGDAFIGAFVAALSEGRSEHEALNWGNVAGSLKATRTETRGSPNRETLLKYLV
jgi:ribokinase